jgi:hypothetical protein
MNYIEYEVCDIFSNKYFVTESREEALAYYDQGWIVYEHRTTLERHSPHFQSKFVFSISWNNNPDYTPIN